jgi:hypothetical protein
MYQEYHEWEKAYRSQAADEKANINIDKIWNNAKPHIPVIKRKRNWLPLLWVLSGAGVLASIILWRENVQLQNQNSQLAYQLLHFQNKLLSCEKRMDTEQHGVDAIKTINWDTKHLPKSTEQTIKSAQDKAISQNAIPEMSIAREETPAAVEISQGILREKIYLPNLPRSQALSLSADKIEIPNYTRVKKPSISKIQENFISITPYFGFSGLKGELNSEDLKWTHKNLYQWGTQLSFGKYVSKHWFTAFQLQYQMTSNHSTLSSTKSIRTETEGITQILIDGSGNVKTIEGTTGATTYHQINATLFNTTHQVFISPVLGYTLYKKQQPFLSVFTSAQWLLFNQSSGKAPLGNQPLGKALVEQWNYRQKFPSFGVGFTAYQPLYRNWKLGYGVQAQYHTDQFSSAEMILKRQGISMNIFLGLQNNF